MEAADIPLKDRPFKRDYGTGNACPYCGATIIHRTPVPQSHCGKIGCKAKAKINRQRQRRSA